VNPSKCVREALLCQIKFRKSVLNSKGLRELFQETFKKKKCSNDELKLNLVKILGLNDISEEYEEPTASNSLGYKSINEIEESFHVKKNMLFAKLSEERLSRQIKQQKTFLPKYLNNPDDLIGRIISHKCFENNIVQWFSAVVDSIKIKKGDVIKIEYYVQYDECPNDLWHFPTVTQLTCCIHVLIVFHNVCSEYCICFLM
jgi:hypothetical protein